ncbi:organic cation transporter 1 [Trichonephila inaurata madagascariensis]|uniref:Organic cation transporter 1 n=1 Tax=Trichonephila inaurata madagascariensis TaxID=2747483 RepID=A0A8X7C3M1_9ARAC|nr:organic cation transporter 1 [Trichonephila inaurata madagascariensis]
MEFEDILIQVGGYGKFQRNLTIFFLIPVSCVLPCFWMNFIFMVSVPDHWCHVPELSNLSIAQQRMLISPPGNPSCSMYNMNYSQVLDAESFMEANNTDVIVPCIHGWQYDKQNYDATASTKFDLVCDKSHYPSLLLTLQNVGSLIGTPIYGILSDKFGRKLLFLILAIIISSTEIASVLVNDFMIFAVLRTINGSVLPSMFTSAFVLISEIVAPDMRAHMNGVINCSWTFGLCVLPLVAYFSRTWVILGAVSAGSGFCILVYYFFLPESPSWFLSQGRYEEAAAVMMKIAKSNGKPEEHDYILKQLQALGDKLKQTKDEEKKDTQSGFFKYPRLRRNFIILSICWAAFYVAYSGLTYNIVNLSGNEFLNFFLLSVVEVPGNLTFWFLMDRYGRRWSAAIGFTLIGFICFLPILDFESSDIVASMLSKFLISGLFMITDQQGSELFPTVFRTFGIGTGKTVATAATLFIPYISVLGHYGKALPFVLVGVTCLITGVAATFLPETLNENLPQTITDAEAFGKDQKYFSWTRKGKKAEEWPHNTNEISVRL